jgi:predicted GIY-YIG superfamily endonuclease
MDDDLVDDISIVVKPFPFKYYCYIISNEKDNTYNGYTTNLNRRIRQHNGELVGGARATRGRGPWKYVAILTSLGWTNTSSAMRHEWSIKYPTRRRPRPSKYNGEFGRIESLEHAVERMSESGEDVYCFTPQKHISHITRTCATHPFVKVKCIDEMCSYDSSKSFL